MGDGPALIPSWGVWEWGAESGRQQHPGLASHRWSVCLAAKGATGSGCLAGEELRVMGLSGEAKGARDLTLGAGLGVLLCSSPTPSLSFLPHQTNRKENVSCALCSVPQPAAAPICWSQRSF